MARFTVFLIVLSVILCGCATMRYPRAYKVEGKEFREFKELDDDRALKLVALIYNVSHESWEDSEARSLALDEYIKLLRKRNSKYIKKSGIFNIKYDKVRISSWKNSELEKLYDLLAPKADNYFMEAAPKLTEEENARRIMYLTAINCIAREMEKRQKTDIIVGTAGQVILTALSVALSML